MLLTKPMWLLFDKLRQWHDRRTMDPAHALGRRGEDVAHRFLQSEGYDVIERNWRSRSGLNELDLIAWEKGFPDRLIVVEVKSRSTNIFAAPDRNLSQNKEISIRRATRDFCRLKNINEALVRFDSLSIVFEPHLRIEHNRDAFNWQTREDYALLRLARSS